MSLVGPEDGSLIFLPGLGGSSVDPLLAEATWLLRAATGTGENEGTAGAVLDAAVAYMDGTERAGVASGHEPATATTPDAAALDLTGDFCIAVDVHPLWSPTIPCEFVAKPLDGGDTDDCFAFGISATTGVPFVEFTRDAETAHEAHTFSTPTATVQIEPGTDGDTDRKQWVLEFDADNGAGGWTANLYSGTPGATTLLSSIVNTTDGAVTIETSSLPLYVGRPLYGAMYRARLYSGRLASPTLVAEFYPDRDWTSGTTMTAGGTTSEEWSGVGTAEAEGLAAAKVPDDAALDIAAGDDSTLAFWFTTPFLADVDGETFIVAERSDGTFGVNFRGFRLLDIKIDGFFLDGFGTLTADGTDTVIALENSGYTAGEHTVVVTIDRGTDTQTAYLNGVQFDTADISAVGAIDPASSLILAAAAHHAAAKWDRVLTADEIAALPYLLA